MWRGPMACDEWHADKAGAIARPYPRWQDAKRQGIVPPYWRTVKDDSGT
jgi:hypothetical protein